MRIRQAADEVLRPKVHRGPAPVGSVRASQLLRHPHGSPLALLAAIVLAASIFGLAGMSPPAVEAQPGRRLPVGQRPAMAAPTSCRIGVYVESIHSLDVDNDTFDADFWIWSVCPNDRFKPLTTIEFVNGDNVQMSDVSRTTVAGEVWDSAKVSGTFRYHWDLTDYPFDRHALKIQMEDSTNLANSLVFQPDVAGSIVNPDLRLEAWRVTSFKLTSGTHTYHTTFGDPSDPAGSTAYSQLAVTFNLKRTDYIGFIKLTFVVYIAFLLSLISYFLNLRNPIVLTARLTMISAALFAVAVNLRTATEALSSEEGLTLVGKIHVAALIAILIDAAAALVTQLLVERGKPAAEVTRFDRIVMIAVVIGFAAANAWLIGRAALG